MDLLRNCTSGVHLISCFQTIHYRVYVLDLEGQDVKSDQTTFQKLIDIENSLNEFVPLLSIDSERSELWAFAGASPKNNELPVPQAQLTSNLDDIIKTPSDYGAKLYEQGQAKPADLLAENVRNDTSKFKPYTSANVCRNFLAACAKSIFRQLASAGFIPLNMRTFATRSRTRKDWSGLAKWDILSLSIQLNYIGSLRIGMTWDDDDDDVNISCLSDTLDKTYLSSHYYDAPLTVRLSPSGELALAWPSFSSANVSFSTTLAQLLPSDIFTTPERISWRDSVVRWLTSNNLYLHDLQSDHQWVNILFSCHNRQFTNSVFGRYTKDNAICVEWPIQLCFTQISDRKLKSDAAQPYSASFEYDILSQISWFQQGNLHGFVDPLQSALDWLENKSLRESESEARAARAAAETEDSTIAQGTSPGNFDWLSPNDNRPLTSQESQHIYPTPSDGLPNQVTPSAISAETNFVSAGGPIDTGIASIEPMDLEEKPVDTNPAENAHLIRQSSFGDSDRYLGAMTLTDMDFDFFNQPEDISMGTDLSIQDMEVVVDQENRNLHDLEPIEEGDENEVVQDARFLPESVTTTSENKPTGTNSQISPAFDESIVIDDHIVHPMDNQTQMGAESMLDGADDVSLGHLTKHDQPFDDSKYSGGGRFGFGLRRDDTKWKNTIPEAKFMNIPGDQRSSTSLFRNTKALSRQWRVPSSGDENSADGDSDTSESDFNLQAPLYVRPRSGLPFKLSNALLINEGAQELARPNSSDFSITANSILNSIFAGSPGCWLLMPYLRFDLHQFELEQNLPLLEAYEKTFISQLLARQIVFGLLGPNVLEQYDKTTQLTQLKADCRSNNMKSITKILNNLFSASFHSEIDLSNYLLCESPDETLEKDRLIAPITPPHICVQKAGASWTLAASAANFWETLGLEPMNGPKTVSAFVVYPWSQAIEESIDYFLQAIESSWQSQKLGGHDPGYLDDGTRPGHIPVQLGVLGPDNTLEGATFGGYRDSCRNLGTRLKNTLRPEDTAVIYIINPFRDKKALSILCECFMDVLKAYGSALPPMEQLDARNIVLQIVPIELVASPNTPIFLDPELSATLAHKVYGLCPTPSRNATNKDLTIPSGASLTLAKPLPKSIRFQLSSNPSSHILAEWSRIHVAYSESICGRWIAAAWTNDTGEYQHTAFYSQNEEVKLNAIIEEIWNTTLDIIKAIDVHWRIIVARVGVLSMPEQSIWHDLAAKRASIHHALCLVSVETCPCLTVGIKRAAKVALLETPSAMTNIHSTPVSTPHPPHNLSPAPPSPSNPAATTPSNFLVADQVSISDIEAHVQLIDKTDESWGFVLPSRLNVANSMLDHNLALASGYLMKRTGVSGDDAPVLMEVNLMHLQEAGKIFNAQQAHEELQSAKGRRYEKILGEILIMYRNLGLLARLRKIEGKESCTPWHVAVAINGAEGLRKFMVFS